MKRSPCEVVVKRQGSELSVKEGRGLPEGRIRGEEESGPSRKVRENLLSRETCLSEQKGEIQELGRAPSKRPVGQEIEKHKTTEEKEANSPGNGDGATAGD